MGKQRTSEGQGSASSRNDGPDLSPASRVVGAPPAVPDSAPLRDMLAGYLGLLDTVEQQRRQARLPRRAWAWATGRIATERVRRGLDGLERRYRARRAIGGPLDPTTADDQERVAELAAALPAPPSRAWTIWLVVGTLLLARIILSVTKGLLPSAEEVGTLKVAASPSAVALPSLPSGDALAPLVAVVDKLSAASPADVGRLADIVFTTSVLATSVVLTTLAVAVYLMLRPLACGASAARILCHGSAGRRRWSAYADEHRRASALRIHEREQAVFAPIGMNAPADSSADLLAKACLWASLLVLAAAGWHTFLAGGIVGSDDSYAFDISFTRVGRYSAIYAWVAGAIASLAVVRLTWIARELRRRRVERRPPGPAGRGPSTPRAILAYASPLVAAVIAFALYAVPDHRPPSAWVITNKYNYVKRSHKYVKRSLDRGVISVRFACDETCHIDAARFLHPGDGFARPWTPDTTAADVTDQPGPNPKEVGAAVKKFVSRDVVVSGATRTGTWGFATPPRGRSLWPQLRHGEIVPELRFADSEGNRTIVPLWWSYWECDPRWRSTLSIPPYC